METVITLFLKFRINQVHNFKITDLEKTGLNVVAIVCDQGSNNRSFLHQVENVILKKPYIKYGDKKIFVLCDPPHLLKNIQNNLKKTDFEINGKIVNCQYIVDFYDELSVYEFLWNKTYQETGCLVYPPPAMITFVDRLETLFEWHFWRYYSHATCTSKIR